ncbi:MAG: hypothetical protein MK066_14800, partial [Crocinitomicaceae bacterium]|nr:hypothetical protein [Crocinitomicaceae bacterium]
MIVQLKTALVYILFSFFWVFIGYSQQHNFRSFNVEDGLTQSQVYAMYQDATGCIWLGTRGGGISIFNGVDFVTYSEKDGLTSNYINDIAKGPNDEILIGTSYGLSVYDGLSFTSVVFPEEYTPVVRGILVQEGNVLLATNVGVFQYNFSQRRKVTRLFDEEFDATSLALTKSGLLWIGTNKGLYSWNKNVLKKYSDESKYMRNSITCLELDNLGALWIGTYGDGMYCHKNSDFFRVDYQLELYRKTVLDIYADSLNDLWIGTLNDGVVHYQSGNKVFSGIGESEGLSNNHVRSILQDNNQDIWFGTSGGGVNHYLGKQFTIYDQSTGLGGNFIYSVARDSKGNLWVGNSRNGVSCMYPDGIVGYNGSNGFLDVKVKAIATGKDRVWLGTERAGLFIYINDEFEEIHEVNRAFIKQIKIDKSGSAWLATAGSGLIKVTPKKKGNYLIEKWTMSDGLLSNRLTALEFDKWGRLWYATEGHGIGCFTKDNTLIQSFNENNGLASNFIRSLCLDSDGRLWVGTAGEGVSAITIYEKKKKIIHVSQSNGLISNNIYILGRDESGNIIAGSEKGLDYLFLGENGNLSRIKHYGKSEGFTGVETCQNAIWNDHDG